MSSDPVPPKPTEAELRILRVIWARGPSRVREVFDQLNLDQATGYTTVLKLMQIMTEKGLLTRQGTGRQHVYAPTVSEERTQRQLVAHLLDRAFGGSTPRLVLQALAAKRASAEELTEIRRLLRRYEKGEA